MISVHSGSIRERDRIRWFHRLLLFALSLVVTFWSARWLRWTIQQQQQQQEKDLHALVRTVTSIAWIIIGPTVAIVSLLPVQQYFGTVQVLQWSDGEQQSCSICRSKGSLELFNQRHLSDVIMCRTREKFTEKHLIHCQVCGHIGLPNHKIDESTVGDNNIFERTNVGTNGEIDDPVVKANCILSTSKPKRALMREVYDELVSSKVASLEEFYSSRKDIEMVESGTCSECSSSTGSVGSDTSPTFGLSLLV